MYLMGEWEGLGKTCYIHHHNLFNPTIGLDQISSFEDKTFKSRSFVLQFVGRLDKETNPHCFKRSRAPSIGHTFWIFWPILGDIYISLLSWEKNKHRTRIYFSQWRKSKKLALLLSAMVKCEFKQVPCFKVENQVKIYHPSE